MQERMSNQEFTQWKAFYVLRNAEEEKERANVIAEAKKNLCMLLFYSIIMIFFILHLMYHNFPFLVPQMLNNNTENNINQSGGRIIITDS